MKKIVFLLFLLCSCNVEPTRTPIKKPFLIVQKFNDYNLGFSKFYYRDSLNNEYSFTDSTNKYEIGQIIK